jgi:retron-type reverse transcriptase
MYEKLMDEVVTDENRGRALEAVKRNRGARRLGIPTVQDRLIQQMMLQALTAIFDPMFSERSYGFRPGRSAMVDGLVEASVEGTPQGGPLSPMLANIYLDALDKELERRGHTFCRYADDCNIYVGSQAAAERGGSGNASSWAFDWIAKSGSE